jgi:hypothetical protein
MPICQLVIVLAALVILGDGLRVFAGAATQPSLALLLDDSDDGSKAATSPASNPSSGRYFCNLLDNRSSYGKDFFHDPFLGPELDSEQQIELDYAHGENAGARDDELDAEFEWNILGPLSVAGEFGWDSERQTGFQGGDDGDDFEQENAAGFEDVDLAAYMPFFQFVSGGGQFDYTAVARLDVGIPTRTAVSGTDVQLTPYLGQLLRIGEHVSLEMWTGSQFTIAPDQTSQFIYGASLGYRIRHDQLPVPFTDRLTPIFELDGQAPFSNGGRDALFGVVGVEIGFKAIGEMQPQIAIGYQFPIDAGASEQLRWGIIAQIKLEF